MIREHLRSNVVGYVALFCFAMSGTAVALDGRDTVFSDDIVDGQVRTNDISDSNGVRSADVRDDVLAGGGLTAADLGPNSVAASEIASEGVGSPEIARDAVNSPEIGAGSVQADEIGLGAVGASEIASEGVGSPEIENESIGSGDIAFDAVGKSELDDDAVGARSIVELHEHEGTTEFVHDGTAHDGAYGVATGTVSCPLTEKMVSVSLDWVETNGHNETFVANVPEIDRSGDDTARITGAYDGGGGVGNSAIFHTVATCLGP
jgi:hypothetical protein